MKLVVPIRPKVESGPLQALAIVSEFADGSESLNNISPRDLLRAIWQQPSNFRVFHGRTSDGIEAARQLIATQSIDVVVMTDVNAISRNATVACEFIRFCVANQARVIAFHDGVDTEELHHASPRFQQCMLGFLAIPDA